MANLSTKIKLYVNQEVDFSKEVILQDDMVGGISNPYIKEWNLPIAKPTDEVLNQYEAAANTAEANAQVVANRKAAYGSLEQQIEYITENGIEAWQTKVAQIKANNPKQ